MRHAKAVLVALCCSMLWGCSLPLGPLTTASSSAAVPDHAAVPAPGGQPPAYAGPSANEITLIVDTYAVRKNTALKTPSRELFAKADGGSLLDFDAWNAQYEAKDAAKNGTTPATSKISIKVKAALGWVRSGPSQTLVVSAELTEGSTLRGAMLVFREASDTEPWLCVLDVTVPRSLLPQAANASHPSTITAAAEGFVKAVDDYFMNGQPVAGVTLDPWFEVYKAPLNTEGSSLAKHFVVTQTCAPYAADQAWSLPVAGGATLKLIVPRCVVDAAVRDAGYYLTTSDPEALLDGFAAGTKMRELHWRWARPVAALATTAGETWFDGERLPVEKPTYVPL